MRYALLLIVSHFFIPAVYAQTLGGQTAFSFLKLPASPVLSAAGGVNVSYIANEVSLSASNPALLNKKVATQLHMSFNAFLAGSKTYNLTGAIHANKLQTTFGGHLHYFDYGSLPMTDAAGNVMGEFRPVDYVVQVSAARNYLEKWSYGLTVKFINSSYGIYRSNALAADVGVLFHDTASLFSASVAVKNMGTQLKRYGSETEELPFELQAGVTQRLRRAPLGFSLTAQHLQHFDILYNDTVFNRENGFTTSTSAFSKLMTHLVAAAHIYLGSHLEATVGYNVLRRRELSIGNEGNGFTGFSAGLRVQFQKLQLMYARSGYQRGVAANQVGITLHLDRLLGTGRYPVVK